LKQHELFAGLDIRIRGHLKILEYDTRRQWAAGTPARTLLNRRNAIHKDNASVLVARALTRLVPDRISYMGFGNGGTWVDDTGMLIFNPPNDVGMSSDLYNQVYFSLVDDTIGAMPGNQMSTRHIAATLFSDAEVRCLIGLNEPFGQLSSSTLPVITEPTTILNLSDEQFAFDEIGLKLADGTLITHVIFVPVVKTASNLLEIIYTLRLAINQIGGPGPNACTADPLA